MKTKENERFKEIGLNYVRQRFNAMTPEQQRIALEIVRYRLRTNTCSRYFRDVIVPSVYGIEARA